MAYYFSLAAAPVDTENKPTHHSTKPVTTSHAIGKQNFTIFINAKKVVRNYVMVVLSMSGFLIEKLDIVRRLVCGGWYMKRGMVSFACLPFNHQKKFNQVPAVRFKKRALVGKDGHSGSQQHEMAIQREHNKRVSYFQKEFETQLRTKDSVLHCAFLSAYWLAREEITYPKFTSLLELDGILGNPKICCFDHRSQGSQQELFLLLGQALKDDKEGKEHKQLRPYGG